MPYGRFKNLTFSSSTSRSSSFVVVVVVVVVVVTPEWPRLMVRHGRGQLVEERITDPATCGGDLEDVSSCYRGDEQVKGRSHGDQSMHYDLCISSQQSSYLGCVQKNGKNTCLEHMQSFIGRKRRLSCSPYFPHVSHNRWWEADSTRRIMSAVKSLWLSGDRMLPRYKKLSVQPYHRKLWDAKYS